MKIIKSNQLIILKDFDVILKNPNLIFKLTIDYSLLLLNSVLAVEITIFKQNSQHNQDNPMIQRFSLFSTYSSCRILFEVKKLSVFSGFL